MKQALIWATKALGVGIILIVGQMAGGMIGLAVTGASFAPPLSDGPLTVMQAVVIVNLLFGMVLAALASHMRLGFWAKALALFCVLYGVETVQALIEAAYFGAYLGLSGAQLTMIAIGGAIKAALGCLIAALLWRSAPQALVFPKGLWWKLLLILPLYIVLYFGAGQFIAWQSEALRGYYQNGLNIDRGQLVLLQAARALLWGGIAVIIVATIPGSWRLKAGLAGLAFAVFMAIALLIPTAFMPWEVRKMHLIEVFMSNFLLGAGSAWILSLRERR